MKLFYCRVSTEEQNEARQIVIAKQMGIDNAEQIYIDKQSGKNTNRPKLKEMLAFARKGDIICTESISRFARNTVDLLALVDDLNKRGIGFISQKENIDTSTPQGKFILTIFAALAELEREQILQRQREGIAIAKAAGKYKGKPKKQIDQVEFKKVVSEWRDGKITAVAAMKRLNLKPNTFYRRVKEWGL